MAENGSDRPKQSQRDKAQRFGDDPFAELQELIQSAASPDDPREVDLSVAGRPRVVERRVVSRLDSVSRRVSAVACPYLGIFEDPSTRFLEPDPAHRCYATRHPRSILLDYQKKYCLSAGYKLCQIYSAEQGAERSDRKGRERKGGLAGLLRRLLGRK